MLLLLVLGIVTMSAHADPDDLPDPLPIRRVVLPASKVAAEMKRVSDGVLTRLTRKEFEQLVQKAARAKKAQQSPPRLVEARYRAKLVEGSPAQLVGSAQWKIHHASNAPALLRLGGDGLAFNLALRQPRIDNREALLAEFPDPASESRGRSPALYVDRPGEQTVTLDWSARAEPRPEGLLVDLRLPDCQAGSLELEVPADRTVTLVDGSPISGPHDAEAADWKTWRLATGGRAQVGLLLRKSAPTKSDAVVFSTLKQVQRLSPDGVDATATFTFDATHQDVRELNLEFDPLLRPVDVSGLGVESWEPQAAAPGGPGRLTIRLARPLREGMLEIHCLAPLSAARPGRPTPVPWTSPSLRLLNTVPRGETLEVWLHPELRLASWQTGDFRLTDSVTAADSEQKIPYRRLTLQGGGVGTRRPGGTIQAGGVEFRARQQTWWRLDDQATSLVTRIEYEVRQGHLFQLPVRVPPGWEVEAVEVSPPELLRSPSGRPDKGFQLLLIDLRRPVGVGATAALTLRLRQGLATTGKEFAFPDVVPMGARYREGGLAIDYDERTQVGTVTSPLASTEPPSEGLWGKLLPDYYYPFRGESPAGSLRLRPRPDRVRAQVSADVFVTGRDGGCRAALETRVAVEAESGLPAHLDVRVSPGAGPWQWRAESKGGPSRPRLRRVERHLAYDAGAALAPLGASPLAAAALAVAHPGGSCWRLCLERPLPLRQPLTLRATCALEAIEPSDPTAPRWRVPLVTVLHDQRRDGEVTLHRHAAELTVVEAEGLREAPTRPADRATSTGEGIPWRTYRYHSARAGLTVEAKPASRPLVAGSAPAIDRAYLTSTLATDGSLRHQVRLLLNHWSQHTLPVVLPEGAKLLAVAVAGRWLNQPGAADEANALSLPIPLGPEPVVIELQYSTPGPRGGAWQAFEAPLPALPLAPEAIERRWRLPAGMVPLDSTKYRPVPGEKGPSSGRLLDLFWAKSMLPLPGRTIDPRPERERALRDAFATLRNEQGTSALPLAAILADLARQLRQRHPVVVDQVALAATDVTAATTLQLLPRDDLEDRPCPWKDDRLHFQVGKEGVLLTTPAEARRWEADAFPVDLEVALALAARDGRDPSGRFVSSVEWLSGSESTRRLPHLFTEGTGEDGWTTWAPLAGTEADTLVVVRRVVVRTAGLGLMAFLVALGIVLRRRTSLFRVRALLAWLMVWGLALAWLPASLAELAWWPLVAGMVVAVAWYFSWGVGLLRKPPAAPTSKSSSPRTSDRSNRAALAGGAATALLLAVLTPLGPAQPAKPASEIVLLLADGKTEQDATVLAPVRLVEQLEGLSRPALLPCAVLVSSSYEGKVVEGRGEFAATFIAQAIGEGPVTLELPLDGVQLVGDVLLAGTRVLPTTLPAPRAGYAVRLRGPGRHEIKLRFRTPVTTPGDDEAMRQVSFNVPPVVQSRVVFQGPEGARHLRIPFRHGGAKVRGEPGSPTIEAELGAILTPLRLRWNQETTPPRSPRVEFQEAYLWDLRADASLLTALVRYQVSGGAVTSLGFDLPQDLAVRSVQARRPAIEKALLGDFRSLIDPIRPSGWSIDGGSLRLDFPVPVTGGVEVTMELVPRVPWAATVLLPLPTPHGQPSPRTPSYLAYRQQGLQVNRTNWLRLTGIRPAEFAPFWPIGSRPADSALAYASSFRREPRQPPELRLQLRTQPARLTATQAIAFEVGPTRAELSARIDLAAEDKDLCVAEWEITSPRPVSIANVTGPDVSRWSQAGNRLLVWLEKATGATTIELSGWVPLGQPATSFDLPCLRLLAPGAVRTRLQLTPAAGLTLSPQGVEGLAAAKPTEGRGLVYTTAQPVYRGQVTIRPGPAPEVHVVTTARLEGKDVVLASTIEYRFQGDLPSVTVRLRGWGGDAWLDAPAKTVTRRREQHRRDGGRRERTWTLTLGPEVKGTYRLDLRGRLSPGESDPGVVMPAVVIPGAKVRQVLVVGEGLTTESHTGLEPATHAGGQAWQPVAGSSAESGPGWQLRLAERAVPRPAPAKVLFTDLRATVPDGRAWVYEARLWVRQESGAEVRLRLPATGRFLGAWLDDEPLATREEQDGVVWLTLPTNGVHEVVLRYRRDSGTDTLGAPDLAPPRVVGATSGPTAWTVEVPAHWDVIGPGGAEQLGGGATRRLLLELYRSEMALEQTRAVAGGRDASRLAQAQRAFARSCWLADLALDAGAEGGRPAGPAGEPAAAWLARLRQENQRLARENQFEDVAEEADRKSREPTPDETSIPRFGTPRSWLVERGEGVPVVRLAPESQRRVQGALLFTGQWVVALVAIWVVTLSTALCGLARWLLPEQLLLAGLLGWQLVGPTVVVVGLIVLGGLGRLLLAGRGLRALFARRVSA